MRISLPLAIAFLGLFAQPAALADPILFRHEGGLATGTLNGVPFTTPRFVILATADTNNRETTPFGFATPHSFAQISIEGLGLITFLSPTRTGLDIDIGTVGFLKNELPGTGLFSGPTSISLRTWDMRSPVGPISGEGFLNGAWGNSPVVRTDRGILTFNSQITPAVFSAIPEPSMWLTFGIALATIRRTRGWFAITNIRPKGDRQFD